MLIALYLGTTQMSFGGKMVQQTVVHQYSGVLFSSKKEHIVDAATT